jgi:hypothetical protein
MENLVLMEALAEVAEVMRDGAQLIFSEATGNFERVPFSQLDREGRSDCSRLASTGLSTSTAGWSQLNVTGS